MTVPFLSSPDRRKQLHHVHFTALNEKSKKKITAKLIKPGRKISVLSLVSSRTMEIRDGEKKKKNHKPSFRPPIPYLGQCGGVFPADSPPLSPAYCGIITANNVTSCFPRSKLPHPSHSHALAGLPRPTLLGLGCTSNSPSQ